MGKWRAKQGSFRHRQTAPRWDGEGMVPNSCLTYASVTADAVGRTLGGCMADDLRGLSVFVASPGGLEAERTRFFDVIAKHNADDGHAAGVIFLPKGHELAYAGAGRAQGLINEQVRRSDYLIVVFWDKWGMASDLNTYTSGTEEEFYVGIECLEDADAPMRDVVVLFRGVSDRQMSDPGEQLQKVLSFRTKLEAERRVLYRTFDTIDEFGDELRRLLAKWTRDWSGGEAAKAPLPPPPEAPSVDLAAEGTILERAKAAHKQGQVTVAHQLYAQATTGTYDRESWTQYVRFLRRTGRHGLVQSVADRMIEKARDLGDHHGAAEGFSNIAISKRARGQRSVAINYFDRSLLEIDAWEASDGVSTESESMRAFVMDNKGLTWRRMDGHLNDAISAIEAAISLHARVGDTVGQAHGLRNIGVVHTQLGNVSAAVEAIDDAKRLFEAASEERGLAMTLASLGEAYEVAENLPMAVDSFEASLELNTDLNNDQGKSMNFSQLSRVLVRAGDLALAHDYAQNCFDVSEKTGNPEGLAAGLHALGRVESARGNFDEAIELLSDALEQFRQLDQPAGIAGTATDLALAQIALGRLDDAADNLQGARQALAGSPHWFLARQADSVSKKLESALP
jgi:tetratricopeptide (TPR) repeat protein